MAGAVELITDPVLVLWLEHHGDKGVGTYLTLDERSGDLHSSVHDTNGGRGTAEVQMLSLFDAGGELHCFADSLVSMYGGI